MSMDLAGFVAGLGDIAYSADPAVVQAKSRDWYFVSPLLNRTLGDKAADLVVTPKTTEEVMRVASLAHAHDVPLTPRGAGTGNYGQSVPLHGGAMVDLSRLSGILEIGRGHVRALAGTRIETIEHAARETGQELRFFPTTKKQATIGGFIAGGTGGVGSINYGVLRDRGNIRGLSVISAEAVPRRIELRGAECGVLQHSYGCLGLLTEVEMPLVPAQDWVEHLICFADYETALGFAVTLARSAGIVKKLVSAYEWPVGQWLAPFAPFVPEGQALVLAMVAEPDCGSLADLVAEHGGTITARGPEGQAPYGRPMSEFAFGHTILQAQKTRPHITEVEGFFSAPDLATHILAVRERIRHLGPMRIELRLWDGVLVGSGSAFLDFTAPEAVNEIVLAMQDMGLRVANPHASNVRGVGKKTITAREIAFKAEVDPKGLLNPGRFETEAARDTVIDRHLSTDGWLDRAAG